MDPQTTLTMLRQNSLSMTRQMHEKKKTPSICFLIGKLSALVRCIINSCVCPLIDDENKPMSVREFLQLL